MHVLALAMSTSTHLPNLTLLDPLSCNCPASASRDEERGDGDKAKRSREEDRDRPSDTDRREWMQGITC